MVCECPPLSLPGAFTRPIKSIIAESPLLSAHALPHSIITALRELGEPSGERSSPGQECPPLPSTEAPVGIWPCGAGWALPACSSPLLVLPLASVLRGGESELLASFGQEV